MGRSRILVTKRVRVLGRGSHTPSQLFWKYPPPLDQLPGAEGKSPTPRAPIIRKNILTLCQRAAVERPISHFVFIGLLPFPFFLTKPELLAIKIVCLWFLRLAKHMVKWWDMHSYWYGTQVTVWTLNVIVLECDKLFFIKGVISHPAYVSVTSSCCL